MARYRKKFVLIKRKVKSGKIIWYYLLPGEKTKHSTGQTLKGDAAKYVENLLASQEPSEKKNRITLRQYAEPFFLWDHCPHVQKLREEGKRISQTHVKKNRQWLKEHIFKDPISKLALAELTRDDLLRFRSRLLEKLGEKRNTANKVMSVLKTIINEAYYRQIIKFNPAHRLGNVKEYRKEAGVFSAAELAELFPLDSLGPWKDIYDYTCFLLAATTGMSRGEILALKWKYIDFENKALRVEEAFKDRHNTVDEPKWGRSRTAPLPQITVDALIRLQDVSIRIASDDLVLCYDDGLRLGETWWQKRFIRAMKEAKIDRVSRNLKPHSFRHTLNTLLLNQGIDPEKIRAALGWTNVRTQRIYTHWNVDHLREQADFVDNLFEP